MKAKLFCRKCFVPVTTGWSVHMGKFSSRLPRSRFLRPRSRASPASHMNTSIFLQRKEWRGEISETEPARLTGLIWRSPELVGLQSWKPCCSENRMYQYLNPASNLQIQFLGENQTRVELPSCWSNRPTECWGVKGRSRLFFFLSLYYICGDG